MHSDERRKAIADVLRAADAPVSASALAEKFSVSRQIIVGDIALLRSSGEEILATPRGYVTPKEARGILRRVAVARCLGRRRRGYRRRARPCRCDRRFQLHLHRWRRLSRMDGRQAIARR